MGRGNTPESLLIGRTRPRGAELPVRLHRCDPSKPWPGFEEELKRRSDVRYAEFAIRWHAAGLSAYMSDLFICRAPSFLDDPERRVDALLASGGAFAPASPEAPSRAGEWLHDHDAEEVYMDALSGSRRAVQLTDVADGKRQLIARRGEALGKRVDAFAVECVQRLSGERRGSWALTAVGGLELLSYWHPDERALTANPEPGRATLLALLPLEG